MRRSLVISIGGAIAGCAAVAAAAADDRATVASLPLIARVVHVNVVGDRYALRAGDRLFADGSVLLEPGRRRIGAATFTCTVTGMSRRVEGTCTATLHLPLGRISGRWPLERSREPRTQPIAGGSGLFRHARGRFSLEATLPNGDTPFTIHLRR